MRKPSPIKIIQDQDERCSVRDDLTIEFAGRTMSLKRARQLAEWLLRACEWIESKK